MTELSPLRGSGPRRSPAASSRRCSAAASGSRLWPVSRRDFAKQHVPRSSGARRRSSARSGGSPAESSPSRSWSRRGVALPGRRPSARRSGRDRDRAGAGGRDTLAAVTLAACLAARRDPDGVVLVLPSDHLIPDVAAFAARRQPAARVAADGRIVVLGIPPSEPVHAYGYIASAASRSAPTRHAVARFVEKPDAASAAELIAAGCLWNAGMFCFRADAGLARSPSWRRRRCEAVRGRSREGTATTRGATARRGVRGGAEDQLRPCGDGAHPPRRGARGRASSGPTSATGRRCGSRARADAAGVAREGRVHRPRRRGQLPALGRAADLRAGRRAGSRSLTQPTRCSSRRSSGRRRSRAWSPISRRSGRRRGPDAGAGASALGLVSDRRPRATRSGSSGSW